MDKKYITESEGICLYDFQKFLSKIDNNHPLKQFTAVTPTTGICHYDLLYINSTGGCGNCEFKCRNLKGRNKAYKDGYWIIEPDKKDDDWVIIFSAEKKLGAWKDVWIYNLHEMPPLTAQTPISIFCSNSNRNEYKYRLFLKYGEHWVYNKQMDKMELKTTKHTIEWNAPTDNVDDVQLEINLYNKHRIKTLNDALKAKINNNDKENIFEIKNELLIRKINN